METLIKIADIRHPNDPNYLKCALDGQPIEARWDGFQWGVMERKNFLILRTSDDFWQVRGGNDWKVWNTKAEEFKRLFSSTDSNEKQRWEFGYLKDEKRLRFRDRFIDIAGLLALSKMTSGMYDNLYKHGEEAEILVVNESLFDLLKYELSNTRTVAPIKNQGITSGVYTIGAGVGPAYATVAGFASDVNAGGQMDGDLRGEHLAEETVISTLVIFDTDTNGNTLFLTAQSGAEHNGGAYDNSKASINFTGGDGIVFDETNANDLADVEVSKLGFDCSGANFGLLVSDCGAGLFTANRNVMKGDANSQYGITVGDRCIDGLFINNIIYGFGNAAADGGLFILRVRVDHTYNISNNTCIGNYNNFTQDRVDLLGTLIFKNNLAQASSGGSDYRDDGGGFDDADRNVSKDSTAPGNNPTINTDMHSVNDVFKGYGADDYRLDSTGHAGNLAILKAGVDLSGTFTDDTEGQTRSDWYIGASEILGAPPAGGRIMASLVSSGGLAGMGGIAGQGGGLAGG